MGNKLEDLKERLFNRQKCGTCGEFRLVIGHSGGEPVELGMDEPGNTTLKSD